MFAPLPPKKNDFGYDRIALCIIIHKKISLSFSIEPTLIMKPINFQSSPQLELPSSNGNQ